MTNEGVRRVALVLLAWASAGLPGRAQEEDPAPAGEPGLWFAYQEVVELSDLLDVCVAALDLPLEYPEGTLSGSVTLRSGPGMTTEELWAVTNRHLARKELACIQAPDEEVLSIVRLQDAATLARIEPDGLASARAGYVKVLRSLRRASPTEVAAALESVLEGDGIRITPLETTGHVLLAALRPRVGEALEIVEAIDGVPHTVVETVATEHVASTSLVSLIERVREAQKLAGDPTPLGSLLANPGSNAIVVVAPESEIPSWRELIARFDHAETPITGHYRPYRFGLGETAKLIEEAVLSRGRAEGSGVREAIVQDELTGTLIVTATFSQHQEIDELLERLEATPPESRRALRAFPVKHRDVDELLELLSGLLEGDVLDARSEPSEPSPERPDGVGGRLPVEAGTRRVVSRADANGLGVTLSTDAATSRILGVGPPRLLDQVGELIAQLDERGPQVLVEAMIVSLTEAQTRDLGVELQKGLTDGTALFRLQSLFGLGVPDPGVTSLPPIAGSGFSSVVVDPGDFSALLRALETVNDGRTLTVPRVLVNTGEEANLDSILQTPYTTTSLSTTTTVTSFGGTLDAGTSIVVRPQITEGDMLLVDYSVALSSFVGESADPAVPPPRQETSLASVASIPDGYAVILGGLEIESEAEGASKTPLLADIPLIGTLFENRSTTSSRSRFFVFLRCSVMRAQDFEDLRFVSRRDLANAGVHTGAPDVRPLIMR